MRKTLVLEHPWHPQHGSCTPILLWQGRRQFPCKIHLFQPVHELYQRQDLNAFPLVLSKVFRRQLWSDYRSWLSIQRAFEFLHSVEETIKTYYKDTCFAMK